MTRVPPEVFAARASAEVVAPRADVYKAIDQMAVRMTLALHDENPLLVCVLQGALPFAGALLQRLHFPLQLTSVQVSRYRGRLHGGELSWGVRPTLPMAGRHVVLLDDILDEGITLAALEAWVRGEGAAEVSLAVLVDKQIPGRDSRPVAADHVALECPDRYLFGWGMDYRGYWRNLDAIYALGRELEAEESE